MRRCTDSAEQAPGKLAYPQTRIHGPRLSNSRPLAAAGHHAEIGCGRATMVIDTFPRRVRGGKARPGAG